MNIVTLLRETLTQYITFNRAGVCTLVLCSLATVITSVADPDPGSGIRDPGLGAF